MLSKEDILQFKIFESVTLEELDAIWDISQEVSYTSGDVVLEESSYGADSDFFVILQGNVKVELQARLIVESLIISTRFRTISQRW